MTQVEDVTGRLWREYAELRRRWSGTGSAAIPLEVFGDDRENLDQWNRVTAERHQRYRDRIDVPDDPSAIVCVTNRPDRLTDIRDNVIRQLHRPLELVLVLNHDEFELAEVEEATQAITRAGIPVEVFDLPDLTLGACLNHGLDATSARFVAKFDDDDRYGAAYLQDALRAHTYAGAGVVGKHSHFVLIEASDRLLVRFPRKEFIYSGTLAGGTLVIDRERTDSIRFPDVSFGEDRGFLHGCHRRGVTTFAADRFNYILHRDANNTWRVPDDQVERDSIEVGGGSDVVFAEP